MHSRIKAFVGLVCGQLLLGHACGREGWHRCQRNAIVAINVVSVNRVSLEFVSEHIDTDIATWSKVVVNCIDPFNLLYL